MAAPINQVAKSAAPDGSGTAVENATLTFIVSFGLGGQCSVPSQKANWPSNATSPPLVT